MPQSETGDYIFKITKFQLLKRQGHVTVSLKWSFHCIAIVVIFQDQTCVLLIFFNFEQLNIGKVITSKSGQTLRWMAAIESSIFGKVTKAMWVHIFLSFVCFAKKNNLTTRYQDQSCVLFSKHLYNTGFITAGDCTYMLQWLIWLIFIFFFFSQLMLKVT